MAIYKYRALITVESENDELVVGKALATDIEIAALRHDIVSRVTKVELEPANGLQTFFGRAARDVTEAVRDNWKDYREERAQRRDGL